MGFLKDYSDTDLEGLLATGALVVSAILPHGRIDGLNLCPWNYISGHLCPFCGMTRSFVALTHFDFNAAIEFNLGSPLIYVAFIYVSLRTIIPFFNKKLDVRIPKGVYYIWLSVTIIIFGFVAFERFFPLLS